MGTKVKVIGHRGASHEAPENTMAAFTRALDLGADGIEFDVHLTRDGHAVVIHDVTLDRTHRGRASGLGLRGARERRGRP